jgi:hypothetical protein
MPMILPVFMERPSCMVSSRPGPRIAAARRGRGWTSAIHQPKSGALTLSRRRKAPSPWIAQMPGADQPAQQGRRTVSVVPVLGLQASRRAHLPGRLIPHAVGCGSPGLYETPGGSGANWLTRRSGAVQALLKAGGTVCKPKRRCQGLFPGRKSCDDN